MKLDTDLARAIKKEANGDGSREAKVAFAKRLRETSKTLSTPEVMRGAFDKAIKDHGRVPVAVCTASTLFQRRERLDRRYFDWSMAVLSLWNNRSPYWAENSYIDDGIHPTNICEYAGDFIRLTTEEE